ncbi:MAG TPA: acetyl-CoA hydrolase/transferase C-terminal domain-containing protein [Vicinamibacterales bacterium]|nr:acetyl-CoA hydrolase/transferase C-terminal domain-containing protein [Vicinamibacterales bacterium]
MGYVETVTDATHISRWDDRAVTADDAVACVRSGMTIFIHGAAATPAPLIDALARRRDLADVKLYHLHTAGDMPCIEPQHQGRFLSISLFAGPPVRKAIDEGRADYVPIFLSDIPGLFASGRVPLDVAILQLSPPDKHGYCTLGTSIDTALAAARAAKFIVAEINDRMPRTHGNTLVPLSRVHAFIRTSRPIFEHSPAPGSPVENAIGEYIAKLVPDRGTLQLGIGAIPEAALRRLFDKHDLGVHTEMFSDGIVDLVTAGVITNRFKQVHAGRIATSFVMGSQRLYDFVDDNPFVEFFPCDHTNDTAVIRKNERMVAVNSALEVDLSGQVVADSIGARIYSGIGGQMDFIRGAALSPGGLPIIALPSTASGGTVSRITSAIRAGAGVVTTRGHVHWVVTEYGAVDLFGKTLRERADALIGIAHPDFRAQLRREFAATRHVVLPG